MPNGLFDAPGNDQLWVNGKLGITDRIEQVGKARDQRCLAQSQSCNAI
jgi:hypothetical protein